jgi:hypothetical protein
VAVVLVAAGVVALGTMNGDDGGSEEAPEGLDIADLEPALLTADDVGEGFTDDPSGPDDEDDEESFDDADMDPGCREALDRFEASEDDDSSDDLQADFTRQDGASVEHGLSLIEPDEPSLDEVADGIDQCDRISYEDQGQQVVLQMAAERVDGLGDEAVGVDITFDISGLGFEVTLESYGLLVARDGVASSVYMTGPFSRTTLETGPVDRDLTRDLAETADEKLRQVLEN